MKPSSIQLPSRRRGAALLAGLAGALVLAGCTNAVRFPEPQARVAPVRGFQADPASQVATGAIFRPQSYRPLFEDTRARFVGDALIISLAERTSASNATADSAQRSASTSTAVGSTAGTPLRTLEGVNISASGATKFDNKDAAKSDSLFTGTITVTVTEVLPNGYLRVMGDKQVGINDNVETMRFAGTVNPAAIQPGNLVASSQVADARLETIGRGTVDAGRVTGFLGRFFLSFLPVR